MEIDDQAGTGTLAADAATTWTRRESITAGIAAAGLSAVLVAGTSWRGALGASRNDDWGFYRVAFRMAEDLQFQLEDGTRMFFLGQAVLSAPVIWIAGPRPVALQILVAGLGALGLAVSYRLVRMFLRPSYAVIAVAALALGPVYPQLAVSFMTDIPTFTLSCIALLIGVRSITTGSRWMFSAALATSFVAFTIREYAVAAGLAVLVAAVTTRRQEWRWLPAVAAGWLVAVGGAYLWRSGLEDSLDNQLTLSIGELAEGLVDAANNALSLSLFVAPAALAVAYPLIRQAGRRQIATAVGVAALVIAAAAANRRFFAGNYFSRKGAGGTFILGSSPDILDGPLLALMGAVAAGSLVVCIVAVLRGVELVRNARSRDALNPDPSDPGSERRIAAFTMAAFVVISLALTIGPSIISDAPTFDRNLIAVVPFTGALVMLAGTSGVIGASIRVVTRVGWVTVAVVGVAALQLFDASAVKDGDAWELASSLVADGIPADRILGGAWSGFHRPDPNGGRSAGPACVAVQWAGRSSGAPEQVIAESSTTTLFGDVVALEAVRTAPTC